jgi:stage IV sporulation protein FB
MLPLGSWKHAARNAPVLVGNLPPTQFDLNFHLAGIPVRVHPLFWLLALFLGMNEPPSLLVIWIPVVFVSILVHEMGHAVVIRAYGWWPSILLYTFGGLAFYQQTRRDPRKQMLISLAGPAAGFALAGIVIIVMYAVGHPLSLPEGHGLFGVDWSDWPPWEWPKFSNLNIEKLVEFLLAVNIFWGLFNLLPIFPLDGGQFLREFLTWLRVPDALIKSLWVSVFVALACAVYMIRLKMYFNTLLLGSLAFSSYQEIQMHTGRGGYGGW